jgi:hypothetical protein
LKVIPCTDEDAKTAVERFCGQVFWLKIIHQMYEVLFENDESVTLMNKTAPSFFSNLNIILHNYILLEFSKITDPATTAGKENLTVDNLVASIDWPEDVRDKLTDLSLRARGFRNHILSARHKLIAHNDKQAFLAEMTLGAFPKGEDEKFLKTLSEMCDITHEACHGSVFGHMILAAPGDVINFRRALEDSVAFKNLLSESSGQELMKLVSYLEKARRPIEHKEDNE